MTGRVCCAIGLATVIAAPAFGDSVVVDIPSAETACVYKQNPDANYGDASVLKFGFSGGVAENEWLCYCRWDILGSIPQGSTIEAVNIIFQKNCDATWGSQQYNFGIVRVDWNEGTITWNTRPKGINKPVVVGIGFVGDCNTTQQEWRLVFSVLGTWVQGVLDGQIVNGGLEFSLPSGQTGLVEVFSEDAGVAPRLLVQFTPPPCEFDLTTTNTNPGDPGQGEPDGTLDGFDLSYFVEAWINHDPAGDVNSTNVVPGDPGYGQPDGVVNGADLSYYVEGWLGGCL